MTDPEVCIAFCRPFRDTRRCLESTVLWLCDEGICRPHERHLHAFECRGRESEALLADARLTLKERPRLILPRLYGTWPPLCARAADPHLFASVHPSWRSSTFHYWQRSPQHKSDMLEMAPACLHPVFDTRARCQSVGCPSAIHRRAHAQRNARRCRRHHPRACVAVSKISRKETSQFILEETIAA